MTLSIGSMAPDFTLPSADGEVRLSDFRGRLVVLYFYPKDMTPGCTQQACDFRDAYGELTKHGAVVIGVSTDDVERHIRFRDKYGLPFILLSDPDHAVCELYGVWQAKKLYGREFMGIVRSTFLIDEEGRLIREWRNVKPKAHIEDVLAAIREYRKEAANGKK